MMELDKLIDWDWDLARCRFGFLRDVAQIRADRVCLPDKVRQFPFCVVVILALY